MTTDAPLDLSVVIPVRDEESNIEPLYDELTAVLATLRRSYEVLFVEDGSIDGTFDRLRRLHARDPRVRVVRFARNYGQTAAFAAGFARARGRFVVTLDGDLQNDPADIPRLLALADTHDIVCGWRRRREDAFLTRHVPSVVANWLIGLPWIGMTLLEISSRIGFEESLMLEYFGEQYRDYMKKTGRLRPLLLPPPSSASTPPKT